MRIWKKLAVLGLAACCSAPSNALVVTSIEIRNALPSWLQVAELEAYFGATNVAASANGGVATGSSIYSAFATPDKAIDGNTGGSYYTDTIFHSGGPGAGEYLLVTFSGPFDIGLLRIYGRTDCCSDRDAYNFTAYNGANAVASGFLDARANHVAEVRFDVGAPPVPEPASWALMIGGLGLAGAALRRRRAQTAALI